MLNDGNFRNNLIDLIDNPDNYSKEQFYDAFLEITERYLDEIVSILNYENYIIKQHGKEKGNALIEKIVTSNPAVAELEKNNAAETDKREVIKNLLAFTECDFGIDIVNGRDDL